MREENLRCFKGFWYKTLTVGIKIKVLQTASINPKWLYLQCKYSLNPKRRLQPEHLGGTLPDRLIIMFSFKT